MGLMRRVYFCFPKTPLGCWYSVLGNLDHRLACNVPGDGIHELALSQKPQITCFTFIFTNIYLHLCVFYALVLQICKLLTLSAEGPLFFWQISSLPESKQASLSLCLHNSILTPGYADNACAALQVSPN